jgi:hypothetical protein
MEKDEVQMGSIYAIDLQSASLALFQYLSSVDAEPSPYLAIIEQWASTSAPTASQSQLLDALSYVFLEPLYTQQVAIAFAPLLLDISIRALDRIEASELTWADNSTHQLYHAFGRLLHPFPTTLP